MVKSSNSIDRREKWIDCYNIYTISKRLKDRGIDTNRSGGVGYFGDKNSLVVRDTIYRVTA